MPEKTIDAIQQAINNSIAASCTIFVYTKDKKWSGSGFHIGQGYVVTASHVANEDAKQSGHVIATFDNEILHECEVLKFDPEIDVSILKIKGDHSNLNSVILGNSDLAKVGETVAVIGAPEGWHDTVTVGRISNLNQSLGESAPSPAWNNVMFVDAKILQGVSGGMCVGTDGLVIGSVIGVTGLLADYGIGQNVICPSNKILNLIHSF